MAINWEKIKNRTQEITPVKMNIDWSKMVGGADIQPKEITKEPERISAWDQDRADRLYGDYLKGGYTTEEASQRVKELTGFTPQMIRIVTLPTHLGGGEYKVRDAGELIRTPRGYGDMPTKEQHERDHIISVALGGTSPEEDEQTSRRNLQYLATTEEGRQEGKVSIEQQAINDFVAGRISLPEARTKVATKQQEIKGLIPKPTAGQYVKGFFKGLADVPVSYVKEAVIPTANFLKTLSFFKKPLRPIDEKEDISLIKRFKKEEPALRLKIEEPEKFKKELKEKIKLPTTTVQKLQSAITTATSPQMQQALSNPETTALLGKSVIAKSITGITNYENISIIKKGLGDQFLEATEQEIYDLSLETPELAGFIDSMGFSLSSMVPAIMAGAGIAALPVPGARPAAYAAGGTIAGKMAYNMTVYNITMEYLRMKNAEHVKKTGKKITLEQENRLKADFQDMAKAAGLWEAIPEAIGGVIGFSILTKPLTKMFGRNFATQLLTKVGSVYGEELATETITEMAQTKIRYDAKLPNGKDVDWTSAEDWKAALISVAPMTAAITFATAGAVSFSMKMNILRQELGVKNPNLFNNFAAKIKELGVEVAESEAGFVKIPEKPITKAIPDELAPLKPTKDVKSFKDFYYEEKGLKKVYKPITSQVDDIKVNFESTCVDCKGGTEFVDTQMDKAIEISKTGKWSQKIKPEWTDRLKDQDTSLHLTDEYLIFRESGIENFYKLDIQPKNIIPSMEDFYTQATKAVKEVKPPIMESVKDIIKKRPIEKDDLKIIDSRKYGDAYLTKKGVLNTRKIMEHAEEQGYRAVDFTKDERKAGEKIIKRVIEPELKITEKQIRAYQNLQKVKDREIIRKIIKIKNTAKNKDIGPNQLVRLKEQYNIKEWKNATKAQLEELYKGVLEIEEGAKFLSKAQVKTLEKFGITAYTTKKDAAEILGDITEWKSKGAYILNFFRTIDRKIEITAGKDAEKVKNILTRPRAEAVTKMIKEDVALKKEIRDFIFKELGLKDKKYRALIQRYGEKRMIQSELFKYGEKIVKKAGLKKHREIISIILQETSGPELIKGELSFFSPEQREKFNKLPKKVKQKIKNAVKDIGKHHSKLVKIGETLEESELRLLKETAPKKWEEIIKADKWFRKQYNNLRESTNKVLLEFYHPGSDKIIPYRKDYYTHAQELEKFWSLVTSKGGDISPVLEGLSEFTSPKAKFNPFALERVGSLPFFEDAIKSFEGYLPFVLSNKYITEHIIRHRTVQDILAHSTLKKKNLNMFINSLHKAANSLAGKTNQVDRAIMDNVVGRKTLKLISYFDKKFAANRIIGSVSSALMQICGIPNSVMKNGTIHTAYGLFQQSFSLVMKYNPASESEFLLRRYGVVLTTVPTITEKGAKVLAIPFEVIEENVTRGIWRASFNKTYREGFRGKKLIEKADEITAGLVGSRALGEKALAFESGLLSMPLRFQLEVNTHAQLWKTEVYDNLIKDPVTGKWFKAPGRGILAAVNGSIALFLFNTFFEATLGRTPLPDPIRAVLDAMDLDEWQERLGRIAGEGLSAIPGGQFIANLAPQEFRKKYFGRTEVGIYPGGIPVVSAIRGVFYKKSNGIYDFVLPYGGAQLKRILQGIEGLEKSGSYNKAGKLQFPMTEDQTIRVLLFGKYSTQEAREYFDKARKPLSDRQTIEYFLRTQDGEDPVEVYNDITKERRVKEYKAEIVKELIKKIKQNPQEGFAIIQLWKKEGIIDKNMEKEILEGITK